MKKIIKNEAPNRREKLTIRILILLGLAAVFNFFYWFLKPNLIENSWLYWMLLSLIIFDCFRLLYIWYHYWSISVPEKPKYSKQFTVDILTTFFPGEPIDLVVNTLLAIKKIKYPHTTYLCDEANDPYLKAFCIENDIVHVTRNNRVDAKAGNINNALNIATGDICLILDPDHIPYPEFIDEVLPYFEDDNIGFVQTVQSYYNTKESSVAQAAAEQTFQFYGPVMMSMNAYGTVNAIGANCVFRRKALDEIDGHAAGLSEDMHTAMKLHAKGWKSIYVPMALSEGLAPRTLSAYYKQQLKWSRGTFELLLTTYPKVFRALSLRQKLHYGILPFHYLAGFFFMISLLIPIISLFFYVTPWKGNIVNFGLIVLPVIVSLMTIRFYSQRWLIREEERGFHILGGLLLQCTWWVYINGVLLTFLRKKVPYLPTLKNDEHITRLSLVMPNLIVGFISILAIVYGLIADFTPFSIIMSGFALWNATIMFYTLKFTIIKQKKKRDNISTNKIEYLFNSIPVRTFNILNKLALPILLLTLVFSTVLQIYKEKLKFSGYETSNQVEENIKYLGVFSPKQDNGISDLEYVNKLSNRLDQKFDIISYYIPWDKNIDSSFHWKILDSVYKNKSLPLITWEPWMNTFETDSVSNIHVYDLIKAGYFDEYLNAFSLKLKQLNKPIFLRFAHEFDNSFYPWYDDRVNAPSFFKEAWIHVRTIFENNKANNVIWVWNPWKAENIVDYFPGEDYVDWIGVNILNYSTVGNKDYHEFHELYNLYHEEFKTLPKKPVMITEFGTLSDSIYQQQWISNAFKYIKNDFPEINALVYFNSNVDNNYPEDKLESQDYLNWTISPINSIENEFKTSDVPGYVFEDLPDRNKELKLKQKPKKDFKDIKGVNFIKGQTWNEDYHVLSREYLISDFNKIKSAGINTIAYSDNPAYRYNVINLTRQHGIQVAYGFKIPSTIDFMDDLLSSSKLKRNIIKVIKQYKKEEHIISWHLQNDVLYNLPKHLNKPELFYQQHAYLIWLNELIREIKKIDSRPIVIDLAVNKESIKHARLMLSSISEPITIGLIVKNPEFVNEVTSYFNKINIDYIYSVIDLKSLEELNLIQKDIPFYLTSWQDQYRMNYLSFDGLIDRKGRKKTDYIELKSQINKKETINKSLQIKILKRLHTLLKGYNEFYFAMILDENNKWQFANENKNIKFEWSLIKRDLYGNFVSIQEVGDTPILNLKIPENYSSYKLQLTVIKDDIVESYITELNTPYILK